jgi:hypothetical protein
VWQLFHLQRAFGLDGKREQRSLLMRTKLMTTALALTLAAPGLALTQTTGTEPAPTQTPPEMMAPAPDITNEGAAGTSGTMGAGAADGGSTMSPPATRAEEGAAPGDATVGATAAAEERGWWSGRRGDEIVGQTLYGSDGTEIGSIDNVVLSAAGGDPAAVVGVGGFLGIGERNVTIPLSDIDMGAEDRLTTAMTRDQIGALEAYEEGDTWTPVGADRTFD